ncbi:polysaccharide pyruvyl transferase family protein [Roseomonas frigidaquae]|uniref:Polysaccharide pyruvyl transferase family protein n=1 Tax=Falsiroseomonas frigidaquae TaxID=487318 RepID=A0ABX1F8W3_9PROT|nr:polysaccharide pyruvyl transferase family protein [Falsiroseomonas frigidaquae]NKE48659.1 polysaccharide pyruvyl transferase family protein [Falsiroseomonas frigidaquae]
MSDEMPLLAEPRFGLRHQQFLTARASMRDGPPFPVLVNDTRTQNNIGCRVTTEGVLALMEAYGFPSGHSITLSELVDLSKAALQERHNEGSLDVEGVLEAVQATAQYGSLAALLKKASLVVVNGEGSFYDRQLKGLATLAVAILARETLGKPVAIVNQSVVLDDPLMAAMAMRAYDSADVVAFREPMSLDRLGQHNVRRPILAADTAFLHAFATPAERVEAVPAGLFPNLYLAGRFPVGTVLLGGSSALFRADRPPFTGYAFYRDLAQALLQRGHPVGLYAADAADERMLSALAVELDLPMASAATPPQEVLALMNAASCYISGRWHASILAACVGTPPILGSANFFKTQALHEMLELPWKMFDYHDLEHDAQSILQTVDAIFTAGDELRSQIRQKATHWAHTAHLWAEACCTRG